jgi:hypothetical protein
MLDVRLVATSIAISIALMSIAVAEPTKDQARPVVQSSSDARPIRVVLPAPWEVSPRETETKAEK